MKAMADRAVNREALEQRTLAQAFVTTAVQADARVALRTKGGEVEVSWAKYARLVEGFATSLLELGIARGDTMAIMLVNRPEFHIVDSAAITIGATPFSLYQTLTSDQIAYQLDDSEARLIVTEPQFAERISAASEQVGGQRRIVMLDDDSVDLAYDRLAGAQPNRTALERVRAQVEPDDLLTLIYTSGTTGAPKGVQITHDNIMSALRALDDVIRFPRGGRVVSYLPMAHIAERATSHYLPIALGHTVTSCPNPRELIAYLPEVRPTWFFGVPRIYEKLKAGLEAMISYEPDEQRKQKLSDAIETGLRKVKMEQAGEDVPEELQSEYRDHDRRVLGPLRAQLGLDAVEHAYVGAAPTPIEVLEFFHALGIPVAELWGLSESCGCGTINLPGHIKLGTVGQVTPGMELKLADDGEVLLRGSEIMRGYRNLAAKTAETIDEEGWLHTGDVGRIDSDGYLTIVDRKKELIITAGGKNISPANLEAKIKAHPLVGTACVIGDNRPFLSALIVLDPDVAPAWATEHGLEGTSLGELASTSQVRQEIADAIEDLNAEVSRVEGIKKFALLGEEWLPGGDELTPTMKLRRKPIADKYSEQIEALYSA